MCAGLLAFHFDVQTSCADQKPLWIGILIILLFLYFHFFCTYLSSIYSFLAKIVRLIIGWYRERRWTDRDTQFFLEHVSVETLMTHLLSKQLLTVDERIQIDQESNEQKKVKALMRVMVSKDKEQLESFKQLVEEIYPGYRKGKGMSVRHRTALIHCRVDIVTDLEAKEICSILYSRGLLNAQDKEWIDAASTRRQKAERILDILPGKGDDAFSILLNVLKERKNTSFLAEKLEKECGENKKKETNAVEIQGEDSNKETEVENANNDEPTIRARIRNAIKNFFTRKPHEKTKTKDKPKKKFGIKVTRTSNDKMKSTERQEERNGNRRTSLVSQKGWVVTHIGSRVSLDQAWSALMIVLKDSDVLQDQKTRLEKGSINDILCNLNPEEFQNFKEIVEDELSDVSTDCRNSPNNR